MRLLALTKYGPLAASTRQRFIQYEPALGEAGIAVHYAPLLDDAHVQRLAEGKSSSPARVAMAYARRIKDLLLASKFDGLWVHCELFPYLPQWFERLAFIHRKPVVFDYDDAIFHMYDDARNPAVRRLLGGKLKSLIRGSAAVCCGNEYLRDYAAQFNDRLLLLPTVVDIEAYRPHPSTAKRPLTIGWIGSPSTWSYVRPILPMLADLCRDRGVRFSAIGAPPDAGSDAFDGLTFTPWSEATEISSVQAMDIGIMPLPDEPWARGKSGYKLIQYMACGLPVVASPVGVNSTIVEDGVSGLLANDPDQWRAALIRLIDDAALRASMGRAGRARAVDDYSLQAHAPRLIEVMRTAVNPSHRESA
jgi:glycosyltransferase involved in cell wall biosynthesis